MNRRETQMEDGTNKREETNFWSEPASENSIVPNMLAMSLPQVGSNCIISQTESTTMQRARGTRWLPKV